MSSLTDKPAGQKKLWRSFDQLEDNARFRLFENNEFPFGVDDLPDLVSRRNFVGAMGASAALAGLTSCRRPEEKIVPYVKQPEDLIPGVPQQYATTLSVGTETYGVVVECHNGRPTKIEGNELHPTTKGRSDSRVQAEILTMYDPHRSRQVTEDGTDSSWSEFAKAFGEVAEAKLANGGEGLAVLSEAYASPSTAAAIAAFRKANPKAKWVIWEPVSNENRAKGYKAAFGRDLAPVYNLAKAKVVVSLDSDFLYTDAASIANAAGFAEARKNVQDMNRLYVAEANLTTTGGNADHRLRVKASQIPALAADLAAAVGATGIAAGNSGADKAWIDAVAADLKAHPSQAVVLAGRNQPAAVHALAAAINKTIGAVGATVSHVPAKDTDEGDTDALKALVEDMNGGKIDTLVTIGGNPVYNAPADLKFAEAYGKVGTTIQVGLYRDETATASTWHVPQAHGLESWGDARSVDGTLSVIQPMIKPLFSGRTLLEMANFLATGTFTSGHDLVKAQWKALAGTDTDWRRILHDGVLKNSAEAAIGGRVDAAAVGKLLSDVPAAQGTEIVFTACPKIHDGRYNSNAWLQELPHAITKACWDNAAIIGPALAESLGIKPTAVGANVNVTANGTTITMPSIVIPGIADDTVVVEFGYGRPFGAQVNGKDSDTVGHDVFPLRNSASQGVAGGTIAKGSGLQKLATTQNHHSMKASASRSVRPFILEATAADYNEKAVEAIKPDLVGYDKKKKDYKPKLRSSWKSDFDKDAEYEAGKRNFPRWDKEKFSQWGMAIDLNLCTGCNACTIACQAENNIPVVGRKEMANGREMHWLRIDRYYTGDETNPAVRHQPVACQHCENAPCEQVCPVAATVHDRHGLNVMVYNRCIGTRYCANNCPYKVRRFNFFNYTNDKPEIEKLGQNPDVSVRFRGVMEKCSYCNQRVNEARIVAKREGREVEANEVSTACQQACPSGAISFGDLNNPESTVVRRKADDRNYDLLGYLNVVPRTSYLAKLTNPNPELSGS